MRNRAATMVAILTAGISLSGCITAKSKYHGYVGNVPDLDAGNIQTFQLKDEAAALEFAKLGGLSSIPANGENWRPVVDGGLDYVDLRCRRFMDALFWLNRARETTSQQVQYVGAATSAVLAIANATKDLIGIAPLGFGLADQTVNNIGQGLLYHLDPGAVQKLVERKQLTYRDSIKNIAYTNKRPAMTVVYQYAANCLPVSIEGEVTQAIANSEFERVDYRNPVKPPPAEPQEPQPPQEPDPAVVEEPATPPPPPPPPPPATEQNVVPNVQQQRPE